MIIETERLILRPFEPEDLDPCAEMNADPHTMRYFERPLRPEETAAAIVRYQAGLVDHKFGFIVAELEETGDFVGIIGLGAIGDETRAAIPGHPPVEIGWRLRSQYWGQGLAPEGAAACLQYAWEKLDMDEVVAITFKGNAPSRRVMEKIGMTYDPQGDFIHPALTRGHPLSEHVLYRSFNPGRTQN